MSKFVSRLMIKNKIDDEHVLYLISCSFVHLVVDKSTPDQLTQLSGAPSTLYFPHSLSSSPERPQEYASDTPTNPFRVSTYVPFLLQSCSSTWLCPAQTPHQTDVVVFTPLTNLLDSTTAQLIWASTTQSFTRR